MFLFIHHIMFENSPDALMMASTAGRLWMCVLPYCIFMNLGADLKDSF